MNKKNSNTIAVHLTRKQLKQLKECMMIFEDAFTINETIDESCMAILLELRKEERKSLNSFVYCLGDWISKWEKANKRIKRSNEDYL